MAPATCCRGHLWPRSFGLLASVLPTLALAALHAQRHDQVAGLARRSLSATLPPVQGVDVQVVLTPTARDVVGARNLQQAVDDIRTQVSAGSQRGPALKAFLRASRVDPMQALPLPSVWMGVKTVSTTSSAAPLPLEEPMEMGIRRAKVQVSTPWPAIPTSSTNAAAAATGWTPPTTQAFREVLGTRPTTTFLPSSSRGAPGWMAIPAGAYGLKVPKAEVLRIERDAEGVPRECSGGICMEAFGNSGALLKPH